MFTIYQKLLSYTYEINFVIRWPIRTFQMSSLKLRNNMASSSKLQLGICVFFYNYGSSLNEWYFEPVFLKGITLIITAIFNGRSHAKGIVCFLKPLKFLRLSSLKIVLFREQFLNLSYFPENISFFKKYALLTSNTEALEDEGWYRKIALVSIIVHELIKAS